MQSLGPLVEPVRGGGQLPRAMLCFSSRTAWVQKIKAASEQYIDTEKKKREKAYQGSQLCPGWWEPATRGPWGAGARVGSSLQDLGCCCCSCSEGWVGSERPDCCGSDSIAQPLLPPLPLQLLQTSWGPPGAPHPHPGQAGDHPVGAGAPFSVAKSVPSPPTLSSLLFPGRGVLLSHNHPTSAWSLCSIEPRLCGLSPFSSATLGSSSPTPASRCPPPAPPLLPLP